MKVYSLDAHGGIRAGDKITATFRNGEVVSVVLHRRGWLARIWSMTVQPLLRKVKDA